MGEIVAIVALIVVCGTISRIVASVMGAKHATSKERGRAYRELRREVEAITDQFDRIEQRLANLETIVIESEKSRSFDRAL